VSGPFAEYAQRLEKLTQTIAAKERAHIRVGNLKMAAILAELALVWVAWGKGLVSTRWMLLPVAVYAGLAIAHELVLRARHRAQTAADFYRKGQARIEDRWAGSGQTGERFRDDKHVYSGDLDLFGRGCLFELLSTARLPMGENKLAAWLKSGSLPAEILERQTLVAELRGKLDLREELAVTGEDLRTRLDPETLTAWAEGTRQLPSGAWRVVAMALALVAVAALVYYVVAQIYWPLLLILAIEAAFRRWLRKPTKTAIEGISCNAEGLLLFSAILKRLEQERFQSPRLQQFAAKLKSGEEPASLAIRRLARIIYWVDAQHSLLAHLVELPLLYSLQVGFAAEDWRARAGKRVREWVEIAGEMEALLSLAAYSYEHPADPFPEFVTNASAATIFDGQDLGHPLLASAKCVRNSVCMDEKTRILVVSGSNMSGKSTLLRTVGINVVLAMAGAPIRGAALRLTPLMLGTRIRSSDSLQEGRSNFYTEILRIRQVFELTKSAELADADGLPRHNPRLLFLFDELLEGTNSKDRRIGAESLLQALLKKGAIGMVSTHDLALTEISASAGGLLRNVHLEDQVVGGEMRFDYKLRDGVVAKSNAIELMRLIGLEIG
jgi:hypothetical protein